MPDLVKKILSFTRLNQWQIWVLLILMSLGIFLRAYHFHDWLEFGDDQVRDAYLASDVISGKSPWPLMGPFMSYSGDSAHSEENSFHLGPIYYYFQILSAKIFGNYPDKLAYPDLFFSILSIPLFYFFLSVYFGKNLSLGLTGLYAISSYFIEYSRFAMNTNLIPCFTILFLLSLSKFLEKNEKSSWGWTVSLGVALGIGFQLHAITMVLFSVVAFLAFLASMRKNYRVWKKWAVVALVFLVLNMTQVIDGVKTNFENTKILFKESNPLTLSKLKNDTDCQMEANFFFLSSYGNSQCYHIFRTFPFETWKEYFAKVWQGNIDANILSGGFLFSLIGFSLLIYYSIKEKELIKKYFLHLTILYFVIGFLIMWPLSQTEINDFRYLNFDFFIPFVFLGFLIKFLSEKFSRWKIYLLPTVMIFGLLIFTNAEAISSQAGILQQKALTCSTMYKTNLGELEPVVEYMISYSTGENQFYLGQNSSQRILLDSLTYLLRQKNIDPISFENKSYSASSYDDPVFYVSCKMPKVLPTNTKTNMNNLVFLQKIGSIYVFQLNSYNTEIINRR